MPNRPTIVAVNIQGKGYVINDKSVDWGKASEKALELAGIVADKDAFGQLDGNSGADSDADADQGADNQPIIDDELPPLQLTSNISLNRGYAGHAKFLSDVFDSEYLIVDVSQYFCSYCTVLADQHQNSTSFQAAMATDKCSSVTIIPDKDYNTWMQRYRMGTFVGDNTYSTSTSIWQLGPQLGLPSIRGTPTVILLDRQGNVVAQRAGHMPTEIKQICGY